MELRESFESVFSPTATGESALILLSLAAFEGKTVKVMDMTQAYLTAEVLKDSETYVELDPYVSSILVRIKPELKKFINADGMFYGKLKRSLYGLLQSSSNLFRDLKLIFRTDEVRSKSQGPLLFQ